MGGLRYCKLSLLGKAAEGSIGLLPGGEDLRGRQAGPSYHPIALH